MITLQREPYFSLNITTGAYSDIYATLTLSEPSEGMSMGTKIGGLSVDGDDIIGEVYEDVSPGETVLKFKYPIKDVAPPGHVGCIVGVLPEEFHSTGGCLQESGMLDMEGMGNVGYTYSLLDDNMNGRSFSGWSTTAESTMGSCDGGCPYSDFAKFKNYYGRSDYVNEWVTAAFEGRSTYFPENGNADFSVYGNDGRTQVIKKGTAYISAPMITISQLESALDHCKASDMDVAMHSWDEAVAFYTGSWPSGAPGVMMYALPDKRCGNFKTCGIESNQFEGTSYANLEIFDIFNVGQMHLSEGDCDPLRDLIDRATSLISIGQIQGTLRYGWKVSSGTDASETAASEGAVFAACVLPRVYACNEDDAQVIYDNMKVGAASTDFQAVLTAFEKNYECMGLTAREIGRLYDGDNEVDAIYAEDVIETMEDIDAPSAWEEVWAFVLSLFENGDN